MPAVAAIGGAAISAIASNSAAKKGAKAAAQAAEIEAQAARDALEFQKEVYAGNRADYADSRADSAPYRAIGAPALSRLASSYGLRSVDKQVEYQQQQDGTWAPVGDAGVRTTQPVNMLQPQGSVAPTEYAGVSPALLKATIEAGGTPAMAAAILDVNKPFFEKASLEDRKRGLMTSGWVNPDGSHTDVGKSLAAPALPAREMRTVSTMESDGTDPLDASQDQVSRIAAGFKTSPGYEFRQKEGENRLLNSARSRGLALSGGALKEVQRFGEGLAADEFSSFMNRGLSAFGDYNNRLASLAGVGQSAVNAGTAAGQNFANSASNFANSAGNILQSGANNQANAMLAGGAIGAANTANIGKGFQTAMDNYQFSRLLQGGPGGGGVTGTVVPWRNPDTGQQVYPSVWS